MKIFGIMLVKNEVDIVGHTLKEAQKWCDKIFILDNGSTDGTWELVNSMKNDVVIPWKQYFGDYHNGLRADVFNEFKHLSEPGDWWCYKLDADEFYIDNPRDFLSKIPKKYHWVGKKSLDYFVMKEDIEEYNFTGNFEEDKKYLKYIVSPCWSEGRFFRYRKGLTWINKWQSHYPEHVGVLSPELIYVRHYRQRSPQQAEARNKIRKSTKVYKDGKAWGNTDNEFFSRSQCIFDDGNIETYNSIPVNYGKFRQSPIKNFIKRVLISLRLYN
nr:glycosyltransferase family 2 protein [uncultured Treponema sp.]